MLAAKAMARISAGAKAEPVGNVLRIGRMRVKHSVGAATLLIHILAKQETPMKARSTELGLVPAKLRTLVIKIRSMLVLLRAEEIVNPPIRSMIVGENITENIYFVASGVDKAVPSSLRMTRKHTNRRGTQIDVTNKGIASVAHNMVLNTSTAKHLLASSPAMISIFSKAMKTTRAKVSDTLSYVNFRLPRGVETLIRLLSSCCTSVAPMRAPNPSIVPCRCCPII
jgi:hypothetical protein